MTIFTEEDFKDTSENTGKEYWLIDEDYVKEILENQEIVKRLQHRITMIKDTRPDGEFFNKHWVLSNLNWILKGEEKE